jgi:pimeloyl-ACP methyl ester carboxylesterase
MTAREEGSGTPLVWLGGAWSKTRTLLAKNHHVIAPEGGSAPELASFDLVGEGAAAADALRLALARPQAVRGLVLVGPMLLKRDGSAGDATLLARLGEVTQPSLAVFATNDPQSPLEAARHYKTRMPGCNLVFVYDADARMTDERPEAVASLIADFLERHDLFLVRRESDVIFP